MAHVERLRIIASNGEWGELYEATMWLEKRGFTCVGNGADPKADTFYFADKVTNAEDINYRQHPSIIVYCYGPMGMENAAKRELGSTLRLAFRRSSKCTDSYNQHIGCTHGRSSALALMGCPGCPNQTPKGEAMSPCHCHNQEPCTEGTSCTVSEETAIINSIANEVEKFVKLADDSKFRVQQYIEDRFGVVIEELEEEAPE